MNTTNPLLPQGTLPPPGKSNLFVKIMIVFAVHIVLLGGILLTACGPTSKATNAPKDTTADTTPAPGPMTPPGPDVAPAPASSPATTSTTVPPPGNNVTPPIGTQPSAPSSISPISAIAPTPTLPPAPAATGSSVYVVVAGDLLSTIAKKNGVSLKALEEANPGVDPKKLQVKQKLQIPAPTAVAANDASKPAPDATAAGSSDATVYVVKSGDNLGKIAKAHGTTVKALEALNDMKNSAIKAGVKLKVPVMKVASVDAAPPAVTTPAPAATGPATAVTPPPALRAN